MKKHYLEDALTATLAGKRPPVETTTCHGCTLHLPTAKHVEKVTYTKHVARIIQDRCLRCHRPGQVGPFSLVGYGRARRWAKEIHAYTHARIMPPWKAEPGFGEHKNSLWLSDDELALIDRWVEQGTLRGNKSDLPPAPRFDTNWSLGKPDKVIEMPEEYVLGAEGEDDYRHFIVPTKLDEDTYVRAIEVKPGNDQIVHHVIAYVDTTGTARKLDAADPGPGYTRYGDVGFEPVSVLGGWAPGYQPVVSPKGTGAWLPKGADIVLQVHYYRTGRVEKDRTRVALYFEKSPKPARIHLAAAINKDFTIPAGAKRHKVEAEMAVPADMYALDVTPHMHLLGKKIEMTAKLPSGKVIPLVRIKSWDFEWQTVYTLRKPLLLPKGTKVRVVGYFDNSSDNPHNPNEPPVDVGWGEKTTDEMCIGFLSLVSAAEFDPLGTKPSRGDAKNR